LDREQRDRWAGTIGDDYFIFLDESGNYNFSPKGTPYLIYMAVSTGDILPGVRELYSIKHSAIINGFEQVALTVPLPIRGATRRWQMSHQSRSARFFEHF